MKKKIFVALVGAVLFSCSSKKEPSYEQDSNVMKEETVVSQTLSSTEAEGKVLMEGMDCAACHKEAVKTIGPSYREIANKYTDEDMEMLADKIINGGSGNWGDIPMTPHLDLSKENAKKIVAYIMTMKGN